MLRSLLFAWIGTGSGLLPELPPITPSVFTKESVITMGMPYTESGSVGTPVALVMFVRLLRSCSRERRFMKQKSGFTPTGIGAVVELEPGLPAGGFHHADGLQRLIGRWVIDIGIGMA